MVFHQMLIFPLIYGEKGIMTYIFKGEIKDDVVNSFLMVE